MSRQQNHNPRHQRTLAEIDRIESLIGPDAPPVELTEDEKEIVQIFAKEQCRLRRERNEKKKLLLSQIGTH